MSLTISSPDRSSRAPWWSRLHQALMPDYNRKATTYWWSVVFVGGFIIGHALLGVLQMPALRWLPVAGWQQVSS